MKLASAAFAALSFAAATPALASLSGLDASDASNAMCRREPFAGKIVNRAFDDRGVRVSQFVVESSDGTREGINVNAPPELPLVTRDNIISGLQRLTRIGRVAHGAVYRCGAAGHFLFLDAIQ
jgi:hypothetical protein